MRFSLFAPNSPFLASISKKSDSKVTVSWFQEGGEGVCLYPRAISYYRLPRLKNFQQMRNWANWGEFLVFNRWWEESNMDTEDLANAALIAIDDWLDEEIVGFKPEEG